MEYEINVAKNKVHYFRVIVSYGNLKKVYGELKEKFIDCELTVTRWEKVGKQINMNEF